MENTMVYFSESELAEFKKVIDQKIDQAQKQFNFYQEQVFDFSDMMEGDQPEWGDENLIMKDIELLSELAQRQIRVIESLEEAKRRIRKLTFGICESTGTLMDKNRLIADPTITDSTAEEVIFPNLPFEDMFLDFDAEQISDSGYGEEEEMDVKVLSLEDIEDEFSYEEEYDY